MDADSSRGRAPSKRAEVLAVLLARGMKPRHRFGQNFLIESAPLDCIMAAADLAQGSRVLEVGPGLGVLTERLLATKAEVFAVEIDRGMAEWLRELFDGVERFRLLNEDVLDSKSSLNAEVERWVAADPSRPWKLVANLPYAVASPLLVAIARLVNPPAEAIVTIQREVADVLSAGPGTPDYGPLSFLAALAFDVHPLMDLSPRCFYPAPAVQSRIVRLVFRPARTTTLDWTLEVARGLFSQRRKQLQAALRHFLTGRAGDRSPSDLAREILGELHLDPTVRMEVLSPLQVEDLARNLLNHDLGGSLGQPEPRGL